MGRATVPLPRITNRKAGSGGGGTAGAGAGPSRVYRATGEPDPMTTNLPGSGEEDSGSLTGAVLARGRADRPDPRSRGRTVFIVLAIAGVVVVLGLFGLVVAEATGDVVSTLFDGLLN